MKKTFCYIAIMLLVFQICLTSCQSTQLELFDTLIEDVANDRLAIAGETDYWTGLYFKKTNMLEPTRTVYCNGNQYTGTYKKSIVDRLNSYETDIYETISGIEFGVHSLSGNLVYINLQNYDFFETEPYLNDVTDPAQSALTFAKNIAKEYVTNIQEYEILIEDPVVNYKEKDGKTYQISYHIITFARNIQGYYTSDYIAIKVTSKGNLASIMMGDINVFNNETITIDTALAQKNIDAKLKATYEKASYVVTNSVINSQKIVMTPDGLICLYSEISVSLEDKTHKSINSLVGTLTIIEKKSTKS